MIPHYLLARETSWQWRPANPLVKDLSFLREGFVFLPTQVNAKPPFFVSPFAISLGWVTLAGPHHSPVELTRIAWLDVRYPCDGIGHVRDFNAFEPSSFVTGARPEKKSEWLGPHATTETHVRPYAEPWLKAQRTIAERSARYFGYELGVPPQRWDHFPIFGFSEWNGGV
jgi:hypothetical protein